MDDWLEGARSRLVEASGLPPDELELDDEDAARLLDLARIAAHESGERTNAPLLCYLVGVASRGADVEALAAALRRA